MSGRTLCGAGATTRGAAPCTPSRMCRRTWKREQAFALIHGRAELAFVPTQRPLFRACALDDASLLRRLMGRPSGKEVLPYSTRTCFTAVQSCVSPLWSSAVLESKRRRPPARRPRQVLRLRRRVRPHPPRPAVPRRGRPCVPPRRGASRCSDAISLSSSTPAR